MLWFVLIGEYDMLFCLLLLCIDSINARLVQDDLHARLHTFGREEKRAREMNGEFLSFSLSSLRSASTRKDDDEEEKSITKHF